MYHTSLYYNQLKWTPWKGVEDYQVRSPALPANANIEAVPMDSATSNNSMDFRFPELQSHLVEALSQISYFQPIVGSDSRATK